MSEKNIPRTPFDRTRIEGNLKTYSRLVPIKIRQAMSDAADLLDLADATAKAAFLTAALTPESEETVTLFRHAAQCGSVAFALARAGGREVDLPLASETAVRLRGPVPAEMLTPTEWLAAAWCAMASNEFPSLFNLCYTPISVLRSSESRDDDFAYLYVESMRAFWTNDPQTSRILLETLRATEPARISRRDIDYVMNVDVPTLDVLYAILEGNEPRFQESLIQALTGHKQYWSSPGRENEIYGLVSMAATAFAASGVDRGLRLTVSSDYMPKPLLALHPRHVPLVCCPYCLIPIAAGTELCPGCLQDVRNDAPIDMDSEEYLEAPRTNCPSCDVRILTMAVRCPVCRKTGS